MENKKNKKNIQGLSLPRRPGVARAAHIALEACIYRLSNVEPHFINCVVDPQNSCPNWSFCRDIKRSIVTPRPERVYDTYNRRVANVHQGLP